MQTTYLLAAASQALCQVVSTLSANTIAMEVVPKPQSVTYYEEVS